MLETDLVDREDELEPYRAAWDALAVASARPYCAPGWMLPWWRHVAEPRGARLRTVVVLDGAELVGIAPFCVERAWGGFSEYRLLGALTSHRIGPLARPGREREVARAVAMVLAEASPRPRALRFEGVDASSPWPGLLAESWPGHPGPECCLAASDPAPTVTLRGLTYDEWFSSKSNSFRREMRRMRRKLEAHGAVFRMTSSTDELERDLRSFVRLHLSRWAGKGGSGAVDVLGRDDFLLEVGLELLPQGRFRVWSIDVEGQPISSHLFLAAGGELSYFLGGFDEAWAAFKPSMLAILAALEDCFRRGELRFDLGAGGQPYKFRFADEDDPLAWSSLFPRDVRYPLTRSQELAARLKFLAEVQARRLPPGVQSGLRRALRRQAATQ